MTTRRTTKVKKLKVKVSIDKKPVKKRAIAKVKVKKVKKSQKNKAQLTNREIDCNKIERDKKLIMWSGVTFFMVLITAVWFFNIRTVLKQETIKNKEVQQFNWSELTEEFSTTVAEIKKELNAKDQDSETDETIKPINNLPINNLTSSSTIDIASTSEAFSELEELKTKIKELEERLQLESIK